VKAVSPRSSMTAVLHELTALVRDQVMDTPKPLPSPVLVRALDSPTGLI